MRDLRNKKVLIIGLGRSGLAAARHCVAAGAVVTATDKKPASELTDALAALDGMGVKFALGGHDPALCAESEIIVISPGVPLELPGLSLARERGAAIIGELELAVWEISKPVIAVTGTNGKTTTTALIGHLLENSGINACVAGNIGTPLLDVLADADKADYIVLEVSSFQIETTPSLRPYIMIWLNVTQDHLDRHGTFENYVASKARLMAQVPEDGFGIYNAADEAVAQAAIAQRCRLIPFDATGRLFGAHRASEQRAGRAWYGDGDLWVYAPDSTPNRYSLADVKLEGPHNRENMLSALMTSELAGADPADLAAALNSFKGLPHRVEFVAELKGVRYYDDSKGTNVGATIRALEGFAEPVVLIAGGLSKGADFAPLAGHVKGKVKKLVLIGEAAPEMEKTLSPFASTVRAKSMDEAVSIASRVAEPGDVVLLSPACASFDMFKDYSDRGRAFVDAVNGIDKAGKASKA
ncbi:MAG: UDP-N-acetylmuramoyl-L-alanine--D-glutamate ligase [bacterium]